MPDVAGLPALGLEVGHYKARAAAAAIVVHLALVYLAFTLTSTK